MNRSWRLGRIAGIDVYVHATFLILLAYVALPALLPGGSLASAADGIALVLMVFTFVVLHELGHDLVARRFGIATRDITLLPIGGVSRLERMPDDPRQELLVALAGPAVNAILAAALYLCGRALGSDAIDGRSMWEGGLLARLFWVNVSLAAFNLLPAFPMDGGRVFRSLLSLRMDRVKATQIAARTGQVVAVLLAFVGLFENPFLLLIALFVWMGATQEASAATAAQHPDGVPVLAVRPEHRTLTISNEFTRGRQKP